MSKKLVIISIFVLFYSGILFYQGCQNAPTNNSNISTNNNNQTQPLTQTGCPPPTAPYLSYADDITIKQDYGPPEWYCTEYNDAAKRNNFPIYQLSQNYSELPASFSPECSKADCPWLELKFPDKESNNQREYLAAVLKYAYTGNLENDWQNPKGWYSAPYMHLDTANTFKEIDSVGREFMRGMTQERASCSTGLDYRSKEDETCAAICSSCSLIDDCYESWAISFYNARGGYYIKKVWDEIEKKNPAERNLEVLNEGFPDGTVAVKFLFTEASPDVLKLNTEGRNIDYLKGSIEWQADIRRSKRNRKTVEQCLKDGVPSEDCFPKLRLAQIDIAVKDKRKNEKGKYLSPTGWIFGTFIYDNKKEPIFNYEFQGLSEAEKIKKSAWLKLDWVGLMFGNDPGVMKGGAISQSVNNPNISVTQHFGCGADERLAAVNRLSGPIDNPSSSCLSCHALSETPKNLNPDSVPYAFPSNMTEKKGMQCKDDNDIKYWFRNINPNINNKDRTFADPAKTFTLDYSLQLREGIFRYWLSKNGCFKSEEDLKDCYSKKVNVSNPNLETDKIKNILNRSGIQKVQ